MNLKERGFRYLIIALLVLLFMWLGIQTVSNLSIPTETPIETTTDNTPFDSIVPRDAVSSYTITKTATQNTTAGQEQTTRKEILNRSSQRRLTTVTKPQNSTSVYQTSSQRFRRTTLDNSYTFYVKSARAGGELAKTPIDTYATGNTTETQTESGGSIHKRTGRAESLPLGVRTGLLLQLESQNVTRYSEQFRTGPTGTISRYKFRLFDRHNNTVYTERTTVDNLNNSSVSIPDWYSENADINHQRDCSFASSNAQLSNTETADVRVQNVSLVNATHVVVRAGARLVAVRSGSGSLGDTPDSGIMTASVVNKTCQPVLKDVLVGGLSE